MQASLKPLTACVWRPIAISAASAEVVAVRTATLAASGMVAGWAEPTESPSCSTTPGRGVVRGGLANAPGAATGMAQMSAGIISLSPQPTLRTGTVGKAALNGMASVPRSTPLTPMAKERHANAARVPQSIVMSVCVCMGFDGACVGICTLVAFRVKARLRCDVCAAVAGAGPAVMVGASTMADSTSAPATTPAPASPHAHAASAATPALLSERLRSTSRSQEKRSGTASPSAKLSRMAPIGTTARQSKMPVNTHAGEPE
mmetsp:Transcript_104820/g.303373  ORF Transcript_104820/g.303373 Transcript_104820/m.303373 type:complete len:260 (+) Transcript_104820:1000-1779(+)